MGVYDDIRDKIELGVKAGRGPKGSFCHRGGKEIVIEYDTDEDGIADEEHHIVPYLIGDAKDKNDHTVDVLMAWKYHTNSTTNLGLGFRCYKVGKIIAIAAVTVARPTPPSVVPKLKLKRQSCVDNW